MKKKIAYGPMMVRRDVKLAEEVLKNCLPHRIVRKRESHSNFILTITKSFVWTSQTDVPFSRASRFAKSLINYFWRKPL